MGEEDLFVTNQTAVSFLATSSTIRSEQSLFEEDKRFYHNIEKALSIVPFILMIAGTLGNMLALYVLTRKKLRSQSTMLYFASLTVIDTISLYQW
jgi:hypothetical protein